MSAAVLAAPSPQSGVGGPSPSGRVCNSYAPHAYIEGKCKDCHQAEALHYTAGTDVPAGATAATTEASSALSPQGFGKGEPAQLMSSPTAASPTKPTADVASTFENLVAPPPDQARHTLLKNQKECQGFTAHAWIHDRCRECGGAENAHTIKNIESAIEQQGKLSRTGSIDRVRMNVREPSTLQKINSVEHRSRSNSTDAKPLNTRRMSKLDVQGTEADEASAAAYPLKSPVQAQAEDAETHMRNVVAKMKFFEDEKQRLAAENTERLTNKQITQHEHEANVAALQAAFDKKEAQMKLEAEQARRDLEAANELREKEIHEAAQRQINEAQEEARRQIELSQAETRALLEQAEREKAEALAFKKEAEEARAAAQAEALAAHASKDESERKREEMEAQLRAAQAAKLAAEADEEQPSMPSSVEGSTLVAHDGDVHLSDALRSVQKLMQTGSNVVRYTGNKPATFCSIFIRELDQNAPSTPAEPVAASVASPVPRTAQYSLCWCKADERMVHPSRALAFSEISAVVLGRQSTVLRTRAQDAQDSHCVSFIAGPKSLRHSLHLQFGTARAAETWAFGIASLCKELGIKPSVFEAGQYFEQESENKKDHDLVVRPECAEKDDGSLPPTAKDWDSLNNAKQPLRYSIDLAVKCANLPSVHKNTIVCLVDRNERTNKLVYVGQSDRVAETNSPEFKKGFPLTFVDNSAKSLRFNVYDVPAGSKNIEDEFRLGSAIVSIATLVEKAGSEFVFALHHKNPQKHAALLASRSTISISCAQRKLLLTPEQSLKESLKASEKDLVRGDTFTNYLEGVGAQHVTAYYTPGHPPIAALHLTPEEMTDRFDLGSIHWSTVGAKAQSLQLRSVVDVFVGKKHPVFPHEVRDEHAFSLVSKTGVRLDLEAKTKAQRDTWVQGIISFLKAAGEQSKKDRQMAQDKGLTLSSGTGSAPPSAPPSRPASPGAGGRDHAATAAPVPAHPVTSAPTPIAATAAPSSSTSIGSETQVPQAEPQV